MFDQCERCDLHFRHKSQLRLHLRQKHGAVTNTKIRYKVLTEPFQPVLQAYWTEQKVETAWNYKKMRELVKRSMNYSILG